MWCLNPNGCVLDELERAEGVRKPVMEPDCLSPGPSPTTGSNPATGRPHLEDSSMVCPTARAADREASLASLDRTSDPANSFDQQTIPPAQLAAWPISGQDSLQREFHQKLQASSSPHGERSLGKLTTHCSESGLAGGLKGISIPFQEMSWVWSNSSQTSFTRDTNTAPCALTGQRSHLYMRALTDSQLAPIQTVERHVFHKWPPQPRYSTTWDVAKVTNHIESSGENKELSFPDLTLKVVALLALTRPSRSMDLKNLDIRFRQFSPESVTFYSSKQAKQSCQTKPVKEFFFPRFEQNMRLCPVLALQKYEKRTTDKRSVITSTQLLIAMIRPHNLVSSSTVARWLKTILNSADIDTSIFKAHWARSAATSAASDAGVTTATILDAADWATETLFQKFYYEPKHNSAFGHAVLSQLSTTGEAATKSRWYGDRAFWNIITEWLRPRSGRQLFWIIWRMWCRTYQRPTATHPVQNRACGSTAIIANNFRWLARKKADDGWADTWFCELVMRHRSKNGAWPYTFRTNSLQNTSCRV